MAEVQPTIECGFCLRKNEALPQPKTLPCTHVHCMDCLVGYYQENNLLLCAVQNCGEVFDGSPDTLPSYDVEGEDNKWCDVCVKKKKTKQEAVIYCTVCSYKFCDKHLQSHDDTLEHHAKLSMTDYRAQATKLQTRNCPKHKDQPYILGCELCCALACVKCVHGVGLCDNGASHSLLSLEELVTALTQDGISVEMLAKEEQYERLFKVTSKLRAEYDNKTTEMVQLIHQTRDAQIDALKLKYRKLEDEVVEKRQKSRVEMAEFMEDIVLKKWTQLRNRRQMMETALKSSHQADAVRKFKQLKEETQKVVVEQLPQLELTDELQLIQTDQCRATELETVLSDNIVVSIEQQSTGSMLHHSVTFLQDVQLPARPMSVCQYNGDTYVGLENKTVAILNSDYQVYSIISTSAPVESFVAYKDRIYMLLYDNPRTVSVCDSMGEELTSWNHPYHGYYCNMLTVADDQVVIADPTNQRITVYSLTGESLRHIPCPLLSIDNILMGAIDNTSVVISDPSTSKVFRVDVTTGEVMWTLSDVHRPLAAVRYGGRYILLAAYKNKSIYILDSTTGAVVSEKAASAIAGGCVFGLEVYDTTLIVPKYDSSKLLFYQLDASNSPGTPTDDTPTDDTVAASTNNPVKQQDSHEWVTVSSEGKAKKRNRRKYIRGWKK